MAEKSQEQMRAEANARLDRLALHVTQVLAGVLPRTHPRTSS